MLAPDDRSAAAPWRLVLGLGLTPAIAFATIASATRARVPAALGTALAFAGAALLPTLGSSLAATGQLAAAYTLAIAVSAGALLSLVTWSVVEPGLALLAVDAALVALAWALGTSLGRRVQHPSHLLPACVVAASADVVSVLSPEGPSHAIAASDRALTVLATWFPVPGTASWAPALGVGDLLFMGLVFGVARAHALPYARTVGLCVLGAALAGVLAAYSGRAVPALVPIALCVLLGLPQARALRRADRRAAHLSMSIALSIALASALRFFLGGRS